ncbi:hypothetical protein [Shewanella algicola]|uniref:hypothetical protein n=1 Tax=Shewanella algicola TaxID=640633 RepID=UPI002494E077|nr:hypothetical protein [Shewanella algicola]
MFTLTSNIVRRTVQLSVAAAVLVTASVSAQADEISLSNTLNSIEQNMTQASQEMISTAKQEFMLSLQTQIAEQVYEVNSSLAQVVLTEPEEPKTAIAAQATENK